MTTAKKKKRLRSELDKLWYEILIVLHPNCEVCEGKAIQVHHYYYKSSYGHLRYDFDNGISLCTGCHFLLHHQDPKKITEKIDAKRGKIWKQIITKLANNPPDNFSTTIKYYEQTRKDLENHSHQQQ